MHHLSAGVARSASILARTRAGADLVRVRVRVGNRGQGVG